jgi:hypothetical protein
VTYGFLSYKKSVLAASGHFLTPYLIADKLQQKLADDTHVLDEVLSLLLNPTNKQLTHEELVECFDFPDVDLDDIDLEWM